MCDLGINLAGVEVVIRMAEKMTEMQRRIQGMEFEIEQLRQAETGIKRKLKKGVSDG
jgi:hypothetical protein